ncbi:MAG: glycine--tRNA ligase subunit beta, partial [Sphingopyxis sp.]
SPSGAALIDSPHPNPSPEGEGLSKADLTDMAEQAARLCKADLVTEMVGEFPELQGIMGGYYARAEGLPHAVADAIRDHYKPVGQGDDVPTAPVTVAVSLADKLYTLIRFFDIGEKPTGSKDPFALRRAALGIINLILANDLRFDLSLQIRAELVFHTPYIHDPLPEFDGVRNLVENLASSSAIDELTRAVGNVESELNNERFNTEFPRVWITVNEVMAFIADRLKVQQREAGVRHDLIDAVFALGGEDDLVRLLARVHALQAFVATPDGTNLLTAYKRAGNILKQNPSPPAGEGGAPSGAEGEGAAAASKDSLVADATDPSPGAVAPPSPARGEGHDVDKALLAALTAAEPLAAAAVTEERFADAMAALASLRAPIDAFFDGVMVNDPDAAVRAFRLGLLARFRDACHAVADFSKIEG